MRTLVEQGALVHLENVAADELRTLYAHAEAFVFPSFAEGFGYPPVEAMAAGTPVIASDIPTHRWVLGDAALYCDPYDASSTAAAIHRVVAGDESPALRAQLIARGHVRARQYALDHCAAQWLNLLDRLHGTPSRSPALEHHPLRGAA
jgi:glycosyltransferase involved in cell wall biosynthesis